MGKVVEKTSTSSQYFGNKVDYFLFSAKAKCSIFDIAYRLAEHCHCRFSMLPTMKIAESKKCPMSPVFRLMHAQFDSQKPEESFVEDPVDKLNIILFQNKAISFDKSKSVLALTDHNGAFPFIDEGCECHAFSPQGVRIGKCTTAEFADYYIMVFAKKKMNAELLAQHISQLPDHILTDLSGILYNESAANKTQTLFFRAVLAYSENQIRQIMRKKSSHIIGQIPQSMRPPVELNQLFNTLSRNEIVINNF